MRGVWYIASRRVAHARALSVIMSMCIGVTLLLPLATIVLVGWYSRAIVARADATPLVAGAKGNRLDLALASMYWRRSDMATISVSEWRALGDRIVGSEGTAVPLHVRFTAQGVPVVATTPDYFHARSLLPERGTLPLMIGDAVVGASAARRLGLAPGDHLFSDQIDAFDLSRPPALKMRVVGILGHAASPDDDAVFTDLRTAWVLEGLAHGHVDPIKGVPERLVLDRGRTSVRISEELIEYNEVTPENIASFHMHADERVLPLTSVLVFPRDAKGATLIKARAGASPGVQVVVARDVIDELLAIVGRVRAILDAFFVALGACTLALTALVAMLSIKVRARETETLHRIGCSRWFVMQLHATELFLILAAGVLIAGAGMALASAFVPSLVALVQRGAPGA